MPECPFCNLDPKSVFAETEHAAAIYDAYPVTNGHLLIVPTRHVKSIFDLDEEEQIQIWQLVAECRSIQKKESNPDGFNIGINDGPAVGQTIEHAHVHLIPRDHGDHPDPRGGIRWVLPTKADYWSEG